MDLFRLGTARLFNLMYVWSLKTVNPEEREQFLATLDDPLEFETITKRANPEQNRANLAEFMSAQKSIGA